MTNDLKEVLALTGSGREWERAPGFCSPLSVALPHPPVPVLGTRHPLWGAPVQLQVPGRPQPRGKNANVKGGLCGLETLQPPPHVAWRKGGGGKRSTKGSAAGPLFPDSESCPMTSWSSSLWGPGEFFCLISD